jgi:hypothetical protein
MKQELRAKYETILYELAQIKKDERHKIRPCLAGETLEPHLDFGATWAGTISTDMTRFLFSLATRCGDLGRRRVVCFLASKE